MKRKKLKIDRWKIIFSSFYPFIFLFWESLSNKIQFYTTYSSTSIFHWTFYCLFFRCSLLYRNIMKDDMNHSSRRYRMRMLAYILFINSICNINCWDLTEFARKIKLIMENKAFKGRYRYLWVIEIKVVNFKVKWVQFGRVFFIIKQRSEFEFHAFWQWILKIKVSQG